mmetsp:Transcript_11741/g.31078  ORF Transcript_11741/g.31078 Transcript_11741/m.31078 type:complete len:321 (+) Transcript_11741:245-1207(+)
MARSSGMGEATRSGIALIALARLCASLAIDETVSTPNTSRSRGNATGETPARRRRSLTDRLPGFISLDVSWSTSSAGLKSAVISVGHARTTPSPRPYTGPPSTPSLVMIRSPADFEPEPACVRRQFLMKAPAYLLTKYSDHPPAICMPQFVARSGSTSTWSLHFDHAPSLPSPGHDAPPRESTAASHFTTSCSSCFSSTTKCRCTFLYSSSHLNPTSFLRVCRATPASSRRASHRLSMFVALISRGKMRPDVPSNVSTPSSFAHRRTPSPAPNSSTARLAALAALDVYFCAKASYGSLCETLSPPLPASRRRIAGVDLRS